MRVVVVEDSDLVFAALLEVLEKCPGARVVGRATSEVAAVALIERERPDVVLLDLNLDPGSGMAVLRKLRRAGSMARVLVVSNNAGESIRARCVAEGADGFFDKCGDLGRLLEHLSDGTVHALPGDADGMPTMPPSPAQARGRVALDALARRAADETRCPMAAVTLQGTNRQWFVGRSGVDLDSCSRHVGFCAHPIRDRELVEVRDAASDPRFHLNPLVQAPFSIRFYAGAPILLSSGAAVGALCVLSREPLELDDAQRTTLRELAAEAAVAIELMQQSALLSQAEHLHGGLPDGLDPLTGLMGRAQLVGDAGHGADPGRDAMLCINIDRFSRLNHTFGREHADALLCEVAARIVAAAEGASAARIHGDEFALRVHDVADEAELLLLGERIAEAVSAPIEVGGRIVRLRASIGMAHGDGLRRDFDRLLGEADLAMRQAKQLGGNVCQLYSGWMGARATDRVDLEADLQAAVARDEFVLAYQPQVELATGRVIGAEALLRWQHPQRGLLFPDSFIGIAEETGLIRPLGTLVLDRALAQLAEWRREGIAIPRVAVNVSALQLTPDFAPLVAAALARHGVPAAMLELEITESALPRNDADAVRLLLDLQALGLRLSVDDFGTGYSSLAALRTLPVATLKIDRHFIADLQASPQDAAVVGAVVSMAHSLGMRAVAEGVEEEAHAWCLATLGCDDAQGYFFGRPMSAEALAQRVAADSVGRRPRASLTEPAPCTAADLPELAHAHVR